MNQWNELEDKLWQVRALLLEGRDQIIVEMSIGGWRKGLIFLIREALVELLDTMVCDPVLPSTAAGQLLGLSPPTVSKYRRIIAGKMEI